MWLYWENKDKQFLELLQQISRISYNNYVGNVRRQKNDDDNQAFVYHGNMNEGGSDNHHQDGDEK